MLDHLLEVSYRADSEAKEKRAFVEGLKGLPFEDLQKLASGEITLEKLAHGLDGDDCRWIDKYKGTPLFDQALALEQADLQNSMARQQNEMQQDGSQFWREGDKIRLQKRMLDLQLVQTEQQAMAGTPPPPSPEAPAQGAGAPGAGAPNNEESMGASSEQGVKVGGAPLWKKLGLEKTALLAAMSGGYYGSKKAPEGEKLEGAVRGAGGAELGAGIGGLLGGLVGGAGGGLGGALLGGYGGYRLLTHKYDKKDDKKETKHGKEKKAAPNLAAIGSAIKGNLGRVAKTMPTGALMHAGIGAGVGAVGGAIAGGPDHRLSGALGGAALGGGAGLAGSNIARAAQAGGGLSGATAMKGLQDTGRQIRAGGNAVAGGVKKGLRAAEPGGMVPPTASGAPSLGLPSGPSPGLSKAPTNMVNFWTPPQALDGCQHRCPQLEGSLPGPRHVRGLLGGCGHDVGHPGLHLPGTSVGVSCRSLRRRVRTVPGPVRLRGQRHVRGRPVALPALRHQGYPRTFREGAGLRSHHARAGAGPDRARASSTHAAPPPRVLGEALLGSACPYFRTAVPCLLGQPPVQAHQVPVRDVLRHRVCSWVHASHRDLDSDRSFGEVRADHQRGVHAAVEHDCASWLLPPAQAQGPDRRAGEPTVAGERGLDDRTRSSSGAPRDTDSRGTPARYRVLDSSGVGPGAA